MEEISIQDIINSAFDSVNLILELSSLDELSQDETDCLSRNVEHLKIMMNNEEFVNNLIKLMIFMIH